MRPVALTMIERVVDQVALHVRHGPSDERNVEDALVVRRMRGVEGERQWLTLSNAEERNRLEGQHG